MPLISSMKNNIQIQDKIDYNIYYYVRHPDTFATGLVKFGSLIALLKLGILLSIFHSYLFRRELKQLYFNPSHQIKEEAFNVKNFKNINDTGSIDYEELI